MSELGNKLKTLIGNYSDSTSPTNFYFATMLSPTQLQLDSSQGPIPEQLTVIPDYLKTYKVNVKGTFHDEEHSGELEIDNSLKEGDRVVVLKRSGGQTFYIIGRLP